MKPLGQKSKTYNYEDCHPPKGYVNWWYDMCKTNKKASRQKAKRETIKETSLEALQAL